MLRNVTIMATSTTTVIGHVVYRQGRTPELVSTPYGSLIVELDSPVPCIADGKTIEVTKINLSKSVIARTAHTKYASIDIYLKSKVAKTRNLIKEANKLAIVNKGPIRDEDAAAAATMNVCWSKIFAFSNLTITPVAYIAGEELGAGIVAKNDGYRYDVTDIEITDAKLLADINPLDDDILDALGL